MNLLDSLSLSGDEPSFTPSPFQERIFRAIAETSDNLIIEAVAGSGKTTTILEAISRLPSEAHPIFLAFNKSIAEELKSRGVDARTFHSLGLAALRPRLPKGYKVDARKTSIIQKTIMSEDLLEEYSDLPKLVSLMKNSGYLLLESAFDPISLIEDFELSFPNTEKAVDFARRVIEISNADLSKIDFDDMLYLPVLLNCKFPSHNTLFIDEAQDTNALQLIILRKIGGESARYIFVGDRRQAIYGFRGAGTQSMQIIERLFQCSPLPLSVSYRCAVSIVSEARRIVPQILAAERALPGKVETVETLSPDQLIGQAVLCRNKRPLIALCFELIKRGKTARILGRDLAGQFKSIIKKTRARTLPELVSKITRLRDDEAAYETARGKDSLAAAITDKYDALLTIIEQSQVGVDKLPEIIDNIFSDSPAQITLSTIHKSKGLEFPRVVLYFPSLLPSRFATLDWQIEQEQNLLYVAITRAQQSLTYWEPQKP